jgi:integrase
MAERRGNHEGSIYFQEARQRWVGALSLDNGKRKYVYGKSRREVAVKLRAAQRRNDDGLPFVPDKLKVGEWLDHWFTTVVQAEREPTTAASYGILINRHIKPFLGRVRLVKLQPEHVEQWQSKLEEEGRSAETRRAAMVRLRTALNLAVKRQHVARNVAMLVESPKVPRARHLPPEVGAIQRMLETIRDDRLQALALVALGASLRRAEAIGLQWSDVDLDQGVLHVRRRVNRVGRAETGRGGLIVRDGAKTGAGVRTVVLPGFVTDALKQRRVYQLEDRVRAGKSWQDTGYVFTSGIGTVLEPRKVDLYFASVRERAGLDGRTFHSLRHDFAGLMLAAGIPGRVVSEMMGHASYSITANTYQHVPDELQRLAASQLDSMVRAVGS